LARYPEKLGFRARRGKIRRTALADGKNSSRGNRRRDHVPAAGMGNGVFTGG
jgi:hypothetical protein